MLTHTLPCVWRAERAAAEGGLDAALHHLRRLGLAEFADVLLAMPSEKFPALSAVLPGMPPEAVLLAHDGAAAKSTMLDGVSFLRVVEAGYHALTHRRLRGARILDAGCGWGRLTRLLVHHTDPARLAGCDPRAASIELCRVHRVPGEIGGFDDPAGPLARIAHHDVIVAHSVLTRLSLARLDAAMAAFRAAIAADGMLAITARPVEFWTFLAQRGDPDAERFVARHRQNGHAYRPADERAPEAGGDMSVDHLWFADRYPQWELRGTDRGWDELQTVLLLTPR